MNRKDLEKLLFKEKYLFYKLDVTKNIKEAEQIRKRLQEIANKIDAGIIGRLSEK